MVTNEEGGTLLEENDFLDKWVTFGLWIMAAIVVVVTVTGLVESYNGLYIWFATHQVTGFWADWAPIMLDGIAVVGEIAIFASIARMWEWQSRIIPWCVGVLGNAASVAGNIGDKVHFHSIPTDLTAAVPPIVAAIGIIVGLGVLKRVAKDVQIRRAKKKDGLTPDEVALQLLKDNEELARKLQEAESVKVLDISPDTNPDLNHKGIDVLIPPRTPIADAPIVAPAPASRVRNGNEETDPRIISPSGLDVSSTGAWSVIPEELR